MRAAAPAAQGRARARPLRGAVLARAPSPRAPVPARPRLPAAPAARGEKNRGGRARTAARAEPARRAPRDRGRTDPRAPLLPASSATLRAPPPALKVAG